MASALEIANMALLRIGAEPINALTDDNGRARACNTAWPFVRQHVLRSHSWNCVTTRARLRSLDKDATLTAIKPDWDFDAVFPLPTDCLRVLDVDTDDPWRVEVGPQSATFVATVGAGGTYPGVASGDVVLVTTSPHNLVTGDRVYVTGAYHTDLNMDVQLVNVVNSTTFTLPNVSVAGFTNGNSDGVFVFKVTYGPCIVTEGTGIDNVLYTIDETDPSGFDSSLTMALVLRLAVEISEKLTNNRVKRELLLQEYARAINDAMMDDGEEQSAAGIEEDRWITVRS